MSSFKSDIFNGTVGPGFIFFLDKGFPIKPIKNKEIVQSATSEIDNLIRDQGLRDNDTINDYVIAQIRPIIDQFGLTEDRNDMIIKRVMDMPNKPTSTQITKGLPVDLKTEPREIAPAYKTTTPQLIPSS